MENKNSYKKLAELAKDFGLLYVEDNSGLQKQATKIFKKFFREVIVAKDGQEGIELFMEHYPPIIISDIKMPRISGLDMIKKIRELDSEAKVIITSAFDEKDYLLECINIGVNRYLKKPIPIDELTKTLIEVIGQINEEKNKKLFDRYVKDSFEYQDSIVILIQDKKVLLANKKCLKFFNQESSRAFEKFFEGFSKLLKPHKKFLYEEDGKNWLDEVKKSTGKLFNVKLEDKDGKNRHFILKANRIPEQDEYYILSFDDITELNLLEEYDPNLSAKEREQEEKIRMINLLHVLKRNRSKVRLYNSYKGLSIVNTGVIQEVMSDHINIKTTYLQSRAIHIEKKTTIESELFSQALDCELDSVNFETQTVVLKNFIFSPHLPSEQKHIRVMPESKSEVEIFFNGKKLSLDIHILDISAQGCNLSFHSMPAGLKKESELVLNLTLGEEKKRLNIQAVSRAINITEDEKEFRVATVFELENEPRKQLVDYIAKRQMALIREFKGL